jgi:hypothetical protein
VKDEFAKECPDGQREVVPIKRFISGELLPDVNQFLSRLRDVYTKQLTVNPFLRGADQHSGCHTPKKVRHD